MTDILLGAHTLSSHGVKVARVHLYDSIILLLLVVIDGLLNSIEPFHRFVGEEMMTAIKFPFHKDTIPFWAVPFLAVLLPFVIFSVYYCFRKDVYDFHHAVLGLLFSVLITGVITDSIKDLVGRPRPNFFWRCFPDGKAVFDTITGDVVCHGNAKEIKEGYKSFPSGHTSWSFAGLSFLSWYLSGKIRAFDRRGHVAKLCIVFFPVLVAAIVGVSRVDDYWHHWTDVFSGALIGSTMAAFCYLQLFPCPHDKDGFGFGSNIGCLHNSKSNRLRRSKLTCYTSVGVNVGWAPHAYFQMLADRNGAESPGSSANSPRKHQTEIYIQPINK